jgi:hypothetical protein
VIDMVCNLLLHYTCISPSLLLAGHPPWRPPCPAGAPLEKNGRFRWAAGGCWGLQVVHGVEKTPLEAMGENLGAPGPGKFPPV